MCLLFVKPATAEDLTAAQVEDFHRKNSDGYGVMYAKDNKLFICKAIGTAESWVEFYLKHQAIGKEHGIDMAFHLRMRTHGDVNNENTHPYPVFGFEEDSVMPVAMMHNGVLRTGNNADPSKSDTWHYIRDYLHVLAKDNPKIIFTDAFRKICGEHIGQGNKFVLMNHLGEMQIINKSAGKEFNGIWFSNTYAWNPHNSLLYPGFTPVYQPRSTTQIYGGTRYPHFGDEDYEGFSGLGSVGGRIHEFGNRDNNVKKGKATVFPTTQDKVTPPVDKSPTHIVHKNMTRRERKAQMRFLRGLEKQNLADRAGTDLAQYVWTDDDYDYVISMLDEPTFAQAKLVLTDPQIVSMLTMYGYQRTFFLLEEVVGGNLKIDDFIEYFRDQRKASNYFKERYSVSGVPA